MIKFKAILNRFNQKGEKSGWTYFVITKAQAEKLKPKTKTSFRVKGKLDNYSIKQVAVLPMGDGTFILPVNAAMRKGIKKIVGQTIEVSLTFDGSAFNFSSDFLVCLEDEPKALEKFNQLPQGHQRYFSKWIESAKTIETKTKRITQSIEGLAMGFGYPEMIRYFKSKK